jgi:hypothetical protein
MITMPIAPSIINAKYLRNDLLDIIDNGHFKMIQQMFLLK